MAETDMSLTELAVFVDGVLIGTITRMDDGRWTPCTPPTPDGYSEGERGIATLDEAVDWLRQRR